MPGYTMHLAECTLLLPELEKIYDVDDTFRNRFRLGALLPDTKIREDKKVSHFWNPADLDKLARAPETDRFVTKYRQRLNEPLLLGYWAHLFLDECYVREFWPGALMFLDENGCEEEKLDRIRQVRIKKSGELVRVDRFYTVEYYYGDYNRLNRYFFDRYPIQLPVYEEGLDPGIEEVTMKHMHRVLDECSQMTALLNSAPQEKTKVFDPESFENFIRKNAGDFLAMRQKILEG